MDTVYGTWQSVEIAISNTDSAEFDLGATFSHVQVYNPALDNATITVKPVRVTGGTEVQAYSFDAEATGDFVKTTTARATAGMSVFRDLHIQFGKIICGASQTSSARTFNVRGVNQASPRRS